MLRAFLVAMTCGWALTGCGRAEPEGIEPTEALQVEVQRVKVDHILIAAKNDRMERITRTKAEAEQLARDLLGQIQGGADFDALKQKHSDDGDPGQPRGGPYRMANHGVPPGPGEMRRKQMVPGFGDTAFGLKVGEVGLLAMDPVASPYGFHIIKRLE